MQKISVIVPVYNGGEAWRRCLDALLALNPAPHEIIAVDDGSTDGSENIAADLGVRSLKTLSPRSGPAVARNLGAAHAEGEILWFLDSDVVAQPNALLQIEQAFRDPQVAAIFGSYDDAPGAPDFLSQYRNLLHHYVHQNSLEDTTSFWAGCGAIRRHVFERVGGFSSSYARPSIEDIELGYRLHRMNYRVRLVKALQVKHLKRWTLRGMLHTDIRDRAIPWAELLAQERGLPRDLNLKVSHRISAILCWFVLAASCVAFLIPPVGLMSVALIVALIALNLDLYRFFYHQRGPVFLLGALPMHWLYYLYSSAAFAFVLLRNKAHDLTRVFSGMTSKLSSRGYESLPPDKRHDSII